MKRLLIILVVISMFLSACAGEKKVATEGEKTVKEKTENVLNEEIIYVKTEIVNTRNFSKTLSLPATIEPKEKIIVSSKINGTIENIFVDVGSKVEKEEKLCKIEDTIYRIQYEKADTAVKSAVNTLSSIKDYEEKDDMKFQGIELAESQYETAQISYDNIEKTYNRIMGLYSESAVSESDYESIKGQYDLAKKQLDLAIANLNQAKRNWKYNVEAAEIGLEAAENDYQLAKENLEYTDVSAPFSGIIAEKEVSIGENVGVGTTMFTLVNTDSMYANSGLSEKDVVMIKEGQRVMLNIDTLGNKTMEGSVVTISPIIDEESSTYPIKVLVENKDNDLKGGMFATIEIVVDSHEDAISVPKNAVINENGKYYVFIKNDEKAVKRLVKLGYSQEDYYEILEGLKEGETVIKAFNDKLEHGSIVKSK